MTKNNDSAGKQIIQILDSNGNIAGSTYPKRADGLVKKGRACYVNDFTIRLTMSDTMQISEVIKMDTMNIETATGREFEERKVLKLYFDARSWKFNKDCSHNVGSRSFMEGPDKELAEAYMIGDWSNNWTEIISETLLLPKYTDCRFSFWLNGGENDHNNEICRFEILFNADYEQRYTYNLNRNFIKPLKKLNGWELYEIPFCTQDNEYTQFRFVAQRAYMTVIAAKDAEAYAQFPDTPDPYEDERPQRHNLIFSSDGFPKNCWYSTEQLNAKYKNKIKTTVPSASDQGLINDNLAEIMTKLNDITNSCSAILSCKDYDSFAGQLQTSILESLEDDDEDNDDLRDIIQQATENAMNNVMDSIRDTLEEVSDQIEELKEALLEK